MKQIPLTKNKYALVDDEDFEWLSQWKWCCSQNGYAVRSSEGKILLMHRILLHVPAGYQTDHINRDRLDNRRSNLRAVTPQENLWNRGPYSNNTSGFRGVCFNKALQKWQAAIKYNSKTYHLGVFLTPVEASGVYEAKRLALGVHE